MPKDILVDTKIILLELIKLAPGVRYQMLMEETLKLYVDYEIFISAFKELDDSNLIESQSGNDIDLANGSDKVLFITDIGEVMLDDLFKTLDIPTRNEIIETGNKLKDKLVSLSMINANYKVVINKNNSLSYELTLFRQADDLRKITLNICTDNEDEAKKICRKWRNDSDLTMFNGIYSMLKNYQNNDSN